VICDLFLLVYIEVKSLKKKLFVFLAIALFAVLTFSSLTAAARYSDIAGHWAAASIEDLSARNILSGYPDGTFRPNGLITRAEMARVMADYLNLTTQARNTFTDMRSSDWYYSAVLRCVQAGVIIGFEDNTFRGGQNLTREQALAMIARSVPLSNAASSNVAISDVNTISPWARGSVFAMINARYVPGFSNHTITAVPGSSANSIAATSFASRAFVVETIHSVIRHRQPGVTATLTPTPTGAIPTPAPPGSGGRPGGIPHYPTATPHPTSTPILLTPTPTPTETLTPTPTGSPTPTRHPLLPDPDPGDDDPEYIYGYSINSGSAEIAVNVFSPLATRRPDLAFNDPHAGAILNEAIAAFQSADILDWQSFIDTYFAGTNIHGDIDLISAIRNRDTTFNDMGTGTGTIVYRVPGSGREYTLFIDVNTVTGTANIYRMDWLLLETT